MESTDKGWICDSNGKPHTTNLSTTVRLWQSEDILGDLHFLWVLNSLKTVVNRPFEHANIKRFLYNNSFNRVIENKIHSMVQFQQEFI